LGERRFTIKFIHNTARRVLQGSTSVLFFIPVHCKDISVIITASLPAVTARTSHLGLLTVDTLYFIGCYGIDKGYLIRDIRNRLKKGKQKNSQPTHVKIMFTHTPGPEVLLEVAALSI
jgi:hypothetical protein